MTELASSAPRAAQNSEEGFRRPETVSRNECYRARRRQLTQRSSLVVTAMMAAMAGQSSHILRILAMRRAELLSGRGHTRTSHVSAFCRCVQHESLLKCALVPGSRSANIILAAAGTGTDISEHAAAHLFARFY